MDVYPNQDEITLWLTNQGMTLEYSEGEESLFRLLKNHPQQSIIYDAIIKSYKRGANKDSLECKRQIMVADMLNAYTPYMNMNNLTESQKEIYEEAKLFGQSLAKSIIPDDNYKTFSDVYNEFITRIVNSFSKEKRNVIIDIVRNPVKDAVRTKIKSLISNCHYLVLHNFYDFLKELEYESHSLLDEMLKKCSNKEKAKKIIIQTNGSIKKKSKKLYKYLRKQRYDYREKEVLERWYKKCLEKFNL